MLPEKQVGVGFFAVNHLSLPGQADNEIFKCFCYGLPQKCVRKVGSLGKAGVVRETPSLFCKMSERANHPSPASAFNVLTPALSSHAPSTFTGAVLFHPPLAGLRGVIPLTKIS